MELAREASNGPHIFNWDNINLKSSIFFEQRDGGPAKVQSGTVGVIYKLVGVDREAVRLGPMLKQAQKADGLIFKLDIRPSAQQFQSFHDQAKVHVIRVLTKYCQPFRDFTNHPDLQHKPRRQLPVGHKTEQFPVRVSTINEATIKGTCQLITDVYETQLKKTPDEIGDMAIPSINDQLSNARLRGAKILRREDETPLTRLDNFQAAPGPFHAIMNYCWGLLNHHRGTLVQAGSLTYFFCLLDKARLGGAEPDYHSLLAALTQIFDGIILNTWRIECGHPSLAVFSQTQPTASTLLDVADQILLNHATPMVEPDKPEPSKRKPATEESSNESDESDTGESSDDSESSSSSTDDAQNPLNDVARRNLILLVHNLLYVMEYVRAISDGDFGRIEDILGQMAMMYRGLGCNNYCCEMLYYIHNLKKVWSQEFGYALLLFDVVNITYHVQQKYNAGPHAREYDRASWSFYGN